MIGLQLSSDWNNRLAFDFVRHQDEISPILWSVHACPIWAQPFKLIFLAPDLAAFVEGAEQ